MTIILIALAVVAYYIVLPFLIDKMNVSKRLTIFLPSTQGQKNNLAFQDSVHICFLFIQALAFVLLIALYKHKIPLNDNFMHYFYGSLPTLIAFGNLLAFGIVFFEKGTRGSHHPKSCNMMLQFVTTSFEILLWSFISYIFIEEKTLVSVFVIALIFTVCRGYIFNICTKTPTTRNGMLLLVPLFITLLHLFFIRNILATTVIIISYALFNIILYRSSIVDNAHER